LSLFGNAGTVSLIQENPFFGTGYMNEWFSNTLEPENIRFYVEGSDYIFISSVAMFGLIGILFFLPFYLYMYRNIISYIKIIKKYKHILLHNPMYSNELVLGLSIVIFFLTHLVSYPNWFMFIGPSAYTENYFIYVAILYAVFVRSNYLIHRYNLYVTQKT